MRPLVLDFHRSTPRPSPWGWLLLLLGLAAAVLVAGQLLDAQDRSAIAELQRDSLKRKLGAKAPGARQLAALGSAADRRLVEQLATPWEPLLQDLERAAQASVALMSLEPEVQRRSLRLTGEASSLADVFAYVAQLERSRLLSGPQLVSHESRQVDGVRVIAFTLQARWGDRPSKESR